MSITVPIAFSIEDTDKIESLRTEIDALTVSSEAKQAEINSLVANGYTTQIRVADKRTEFLTDQGEWMPYSRDYIDELYSIKLREFQEQRNEFSRQITTKQGEIKTVVRKYIPEV